MAVIEDDVLVDTKFHDRFTSFYYSSVRTYIGLTSKLFSAASTGTGYTWETNGSLEACLDEI